MKFVALSILTSAALLAQQKEMVLTPGVPFTSSATTVAVIGGEMIGGRTVTGAPYSAEAVTETTQTLADGNHIVNKSTSKIYRDSAGRERREQPLPQGISINGIMSSTFSAPMTVIISDPVAKVNYTLQPSQKSAIKMPAPGPMSLSITGGMTGPGMVTAGFAAPGIVTGGIIGSDIAVPAPQVAPQVMIRGEAPAAQKTQKTEDLGHSLIQGIDADGTRTTITIPAGQIGNDRPIDIVSERWFSKELQVVVMSKRTDPRAGDTTYQLTNLSRVEPAASLFEVPPDYQVTEPSFTPAKMIHPSNSSKDE